MGLNLAGPRDCLLWKLTAWVDIKRFLEVFRILGSGLDSGKCFVFSDVLWILGIVSNLGNWFGFSEVHLGFWKWFGLWEMFLYS